LTSKEWREWQTRSRPGEWAGPIIADLEAQERRAEAAEKKASDLNDMLNISEVTVCDLQIRAEAAEKERDDARTTRDIAIRSAVSAEARCKEMEARIAKVCESPDIGLEEMVEGLREDVSELTAAVKENEPNLLALISALRYVANEGHYGEHTATIIDKALAPFSGVKA
jgi:chromosome segregation ATPase